MIRRIQPLPLVVMLLIALAPLGCSDDDPAGPVTTGTVVIDPTPDSINAPWALIDSADFDESGTGDHTFTRLDPGNYTLTWGEVTDWVTPTPETKTLEADTTITYVGVYTEITLTATFVIEIGTEGSGSGQFNDVGDIAIDPIGNVYICDYWGDRVQKMSPTGGLLLQFAHEKPSDIEVDETGHVYVWGGWNLYRYSSNGVRLDAFRDLNYATRMGGENRFAVSQATDELVSFNMLGPIVQVFDPNAGEYASFNVADHSVLRVRKTNGYYLSIFGSHGESPGQFFNPFAAEYDASGRLYVMDPERNIVQIFVGDAYTATAPSPSSLNNSTGFCVDDDGRLYYRNGATVEVFSADGSHSDTVTIDYEYGSSVFTSHMDIRHESGTGAVLLFASSHNSVVVYRLQFTGW